MNVRTFLASCVYYQFILFNIGRKKVEVLLQQMFEGEILGDDTEDQIVKPRTVTLDSIT